MSAALPAAAIDEACYRSYLEALLAGDRHRCAALLQDQLRREVPLKTLYLDLMQRALYEVGTLWERNLACVATEHLASAITEMLLTTIVPLIFSQGHKDKRAIIACIPNEYHQIGARMVADFFELNGWHGFALGANTPTNGLLRMIRERDPDVVGFSMSVLFNRPRLEGMVAAVSHEFPDLPLLLGGRAFQGSAGQHERAALTLHYPRLKYLASLNELESHLAGA